MRQVVLDTETTGLDPAQGHRIIEIGIIELLDRRVTGNKFHAYLNPDRTIDSGAFAVHGISNAFLADKPRFPEILNDLLAFVQDAEIIIHNAPFDMGFLKHEMRQNLDHWPVIDTLAMARRLHPGQKNNLDALCKRYGVDNSDRNLHGALLDAKILAMVYLAMTGGQENLFGDVMNVDQDTGVGRGASRSALTKTKPLRVIYASTDELTAHKKYMDKLCHSN